MRTAKLRKKLELLQSVLPDRGYMTIERIKTTPAGAWWEWNGYSWRLRGVTPKPAAPVVHMPEKGQIYGHDYEMEYRIATRETLIFCKKASNGREFVLRLDLPYADYYGLTVFTLYDLIKKKDDDHVYSLERN